MSDEASDGTSRKRRRRTIDALRRVDRLTRLTVRAAPSNGLCWWYCFGRGVGHSKNELIDLWAQHLRRSPTIWKSRCEIEGYDPRITQADYLRGLRSGDVWADEGPMSFLTAHFSIQLLVVRSSSDEEISFFRFPFGQEGDRYLLLRFVDDHYDNILVDGMYTIARSKLPTLLRRLWIV